MAKKNGNKGGEGLDEVRRFVDAVGRGDNVGAKARLQKILKQKVARRIKDTLGQ